MLSEGVFAKYDRHPPGISEGASMIPTWGRIYRTLLIVVYNGTPSSPPTRQNLLKISSSSFKGKVSRPINPTRRQRWVASLQAFGQGSGRQIRARFGGVETGSGRVARRRWARGQRRLPIAITLLHYTYVFRQGAPLDYVRMPGRSAAAAHVALPPNRPIPTRARRLSITLDEECINSCPVR